MKSAKASYHHGNLRTALIDAGLQLARDGGPDAVVLREVSRRAGVSHNAAYRHFADRDTLLQAICGRCMGSLARLMEARIAEVDDPGGGSAGDALDPARRRLRATGSAYVEFALTEPGLFRTAFAVPPRLGYFDDGEGAGDSGLGPLELLGVRLDALVEAGGLPRERRAGAELAAWSAVHGLSMLLIAGPLRELAPGERDVTLTRLLDTIERGL
ncbi:MAG TPA: TetR/AcrR family transcriptional regulator [Solirubrobacteraceae bacterium]|nr:TetR/AcrR family transcriptional regulator [Solirubrobacteraceae bacterium]